jgi:glycerophosphoryl diester phosphodiesterase
MRNATFAATVLCLLISLSASATGACAHRGDNKVAPENTLPAFASAVQKHADQIEFDLNLTKDGQMIIMHDPTVDRTTNGKGRIRDLTFEQIRTLDAGSWFNPKFAGTKVPTPKEALEIIPHDILCNLHLRDAPGLAKAITELLKEMDCFDHCFLACSTEQAAEAKAFVPEVKICNMSRQIGERSAYTDATIAASAQFLQFLGDTPGLQPLVEKLHQHGIKVNFFEANTEEKIQACIAAGVDFILTDDLDLCLATTRK